MTRILSSAIIKPEYPINIHEVDARYDVKVEVLKVGYRIIGEYECVSECVHDLDKNADVRFPGCG